jgi:hypothetical protein
VTTSKQNSLYLLVIMKTLALILAFAVTGSLGDGFGHSNHRSGRRGGRQQQRFRSGRQEEAAVGGYAAAADAGAQPTYEGDGDIAGAPGAGDDNLAMLEKSVPGIPGEDYPIYAEVPETAFACDGQVDGGYYADPEADCQVFHICTADGQGGLAKYSFLCPNGTVFNQNYFICDWWFNFDCAEAEALYSLNEDIAAEREANSQSGAADEPQSGYGAATAADYEYAEYDVAPVTEAPLNTYAAEEVTAEAPPAGGYGAPGEGEAPVDTYDATREGRNFRGQSQRAGRNFRGRSNGRRQNNRNNRRRPGQGRRNQGRRFRG